jgi:hypothetical protein
MSMNESGDDPVLAAVHEAIGRTFAARSARVEHSFSADLGTSVPASAELPDFGFHESGCVDFIERRSRLGDRYQRVVADGVEYQRVSSGHWRRYSLEPGAWPQMHPCYFLERIAAAYRRGREGLDGQLELELQAAIIPQVRDAHPLWRRSVATLTRDERGRVARLVVRLEAPAEDAWAESEFEFGDFGAPCSAVPPAPEDITSLADDLESLRNRPPET